MPLNPKIAAQLKILANSGDYMAKAMVEANRDIQLTAGTEAANVIRVSGQILNAIGLPVPGVKEVLVKSIPVTGAQGNISAGTVGTIVVGAASKEAWIRTDANGRFQFDITNTVAEDNLVSAVTADGDQALLKLSFA